MTQLLIIVAYLSLLLLLGYFSNKLFKGTSSDYFLASRGLGSFLLLMSLFGTTMTAFALVGSSGEAFKAGIRVARTDGAMVGPSTGAVLHAAIETGANNTGRAVLIAADSAAKYISAYANYLED